MDVRVSGWEVRSHRSNSSFSRWGHEGFAMVKRSLPKVTQTVNGKAISNKPSVIFLLETFSLPLGFSCSIKYIQTKGKRRLSQPVCLKFCFILRFMSRSRQEVKGGEPASVRFQMWLKTQLAITPFIGRTHKCSLSYWCHHFDKCNWEWRWMLLGKKKLEKEREKKKNWWEARSRLHFKNRKEKPTKVIIIVT